MSGADGGARYACAPADTDVEMGQPQAAQAPNYQQTDKANETLALVRTVMTENMRANERERQQRGLRRRQLCRILSVSPHLHCSVPLSPFPPRSAEKALERSDQLGMIEQQGDVCMGDADKFQHAPVGQPAPCPCHSQQQVECQPVSPLTGTETAASRVNGNAGLSDFLGRVYMTTGASVVATLIVSYALAGLIVPAAFTPVLIGGMLVTLGSMFAMFAIQPTAHRNAAGRLVTVNPPSRRLAFATFVVGNSMLFVPLVVMTSAIHPLIIPVAAGAAGLTMLGSSFYAYKQPNGSLLWLAAPLMGALVASIVLGLAGMAATAIAGPNLFSSVVFSVSPYVSIGQLADGTRSAWAASWSALRAAHLLLTRCCCAALLRLPFRSALLSSYFQRADRRRHALGHRRVRAGPRRPSVARHGILSQLPQPAHRLHARHGQLRENQLSDPFEVRRCGCDVSAQLRAGY
jgi:FtsH-binding integral membrane protein